METEITPIHFQPFNSLEPPFRNYLDSTRLVLKIITTQTKKPTPPSPITWISMSPVTHLLCIRLPSSHSSILIIGDKDNINHDLYSICRSVSFLVCLPLFWVLGCFLFLFLFPWTCSGRSYFSLEKNVLLSLLKVKLVRVHLS